MAITHTTAIRNGLAEDIATAVDSGTTNPTGRVVVLTSGEVEVATLNFSDPAFGAPSSGTITANTIADDTNTTGGEAALFTVVDKDAVEVYRGTVTVTGGGGDLELSSLTIGSGDTLSITSLSYTASL